MGGASGAGRGAQVMRWWVLGTASFFSWTLHSRNSRQAAAKRITGAARVLTHTCPETVAVIGYCYQSTFTVTVLMPANQTVCQSLHDKMSKRDMQTPFVYTLSLSVSWRVIL